jgi:RHS repeat-associated protein
MVDRAVKRPSGSSTSTITGSSANGTTTYAYDALDRLTSFTPPAALQPQVYTSNGSPDRATITIGTNPMLTMNYDNASRLSSDSAGGTYRYDGQGRLKDMPGKSLTWDALGRLTQVKDGSGTVLANYSYDALDRLRTVTESGTTTRFRYVGLTTAVAQEVDSGSPPIVLKNHATDSDGTDLFDSSAGGAILGYLGRNAHSDVVWTASSTGAVSTTLTYDPYGNKVASTGSALPNTRWQASWQDTTTGLYYVIARWYAPTLGVFLANDPLGGDTANPQTRDQYAYGASDPTDHTDPTGLCPDGSVDGLGLICRPHDPAVPLPVPYFWQADPKKPWNHAFIGGWRKRRTGCGQIMGYWPPDHPFGLGCAITALAMVFDFYGSAVDPGTLNSYMGSQGLIQFGGPKNCEIKSWQRTGNSFHVRISNLVAMPAANWSVVVSHGWDKNVADQLRLRHPVIARVNAPGMHFVVITALAAEGDFVINDPAHYSSRLFGSHRYTLVGVRTAYHD